MALERRPVQKEDDPGYPNSQSYGADRRTFLGMIGATAATAVGLFFLKDKLGSGGTRSIPTRRGVGDLIAPRAHPMGAAPAPVAPQTAPSGTPSPIQGQGTAQRVQPQAPVPGEAPAPNLQPPSGAGPDGGPVLRRVQPPVDPPAGPQAETLGGNMEVQPASGRLTQPECGSSSPAGGGAGPRQQLAVPGGIRPVKAPSPPAQPQAGVEGGLRAVQPGPPPAQPQAPSRGARAVAPPKRSPPVVPEARPRAAIKGEVAAPELPPPPSRQWAAGPEEF